jgi:hypothetical protein
MNDDPLAAKKRIDEALEALRAGLTPYVSRRMESAVGKNWRSLVSRAGSDGAAALDAYALLKTILDNWREVFSPDARLRKARSYISVSVEARNTVSHFEGTMGQREALRYLDAILEVLRAIGAKPQEEIVVKLYDEQRTGVPPPARNLVHSPAIDTHPVNPVATSQTQADRIRQFALDHYVVSARAEGRAEITIRAGDVHRGMRLVSAMPAVCKRLAAANWQKWPA